MSSVNATSLPLPKLNYRRIFKYWLPLAASWLLMGSEIPSITAAISRLPQAEQMIAAFGIVASISIMIESPVVSLLSTSTAQARGKQQYEMVRRFTLHLMALTTLGHLLIAWTPLFDIVVINWLDVPQVLHQPVLLGLRIMLLWSAAIGWRRFRQGILIRQGETHFVGRGTFIRLLISLGTALSLAVFTDLPGIAVGTAALNVGVVVEAVYSHIVSQPIIQEAIYDHAPNPEIKELGYWKLLQFHWPLASSVLIYMLAQPLVAAALSRSPNALNDLAAWPVLTGLLFLLRAPAVALPEVVIALHDDPESKQPLANFSLWVGLGLSAVMSLLAFTPLANIYFQTIIGLPPHLADLARAGARVACLLPLIVAGINYYRGMLTATDHTLPITFAMGVELLIMAVVLVTGVYFKLPGVLFGAVAMVIAMSFDLLILFIAYRRNEHG